MPQVQASAFIHNEVAPKRIGGNEAEYDVQLPGDAEKRAQKKTDQITEYVLLDPRRVAAAGIAAHEDTNGALWLTNGGNLHRDVRRVEYSSGEGATPEDIAALNLASIPIMQALTQQIPGARAFRHSGTMLGKHLKTLGYHQSYMVPAAIYSDLFTAYWDSFQATSVWAGGGLVGPQGLEFYQKARGTGQPTSQSSAGRTTEGAKPMGWIKIEDADVFNPSNSKGPEWMRVEKRTMEGGFSRWAAFMSEAAGSLALRVFEHRRELGKDRPIARLVFDDPLLTYRMTSIDLAFKNRYLTRAGQMLGALDHQELVVEYARHLSERVRLPEGEYRSMHMLTDIIDRFRGSDIANNDLRLLLAFTDFAPRFAYINKFFTPDKTNSLNRAAVERSLQWSRIEPAGPGIKYWVKLYEEGRAPDPIGTERFAHFISQPSPDTRGLLRGTVVANPEYRRGLQTMSWRYIFRYGRRLSMHPYDNNLELLQALQ